MSTTVRRPDPAFWQGKRVLITGHTGFKGSWASLWLSQLGAEITGFALAPNTQPNLFDLCDIASFTDSCIGDLRDADGLERLVRRTEPQIVLHLGAQSLVRKGYAAPFETFAVNTLGTASLLEALRVTGKPEAVLIVTTDKVYENAEDGRAFRENDPLGGHDPYSASKAAAEIVTRSYTRSFFGGSRVATARAGNVIGGGDFSTDRLVPDVWRAAHAGEPVVLRYPDATRPWQHVLDCLNGYFIFLEDLARGKPVPQALNFAPGETGALNVREIVERLQRSLGVRDGWTQQAGEFQREMQILKLSGAQAMAVLGWSDLLAADAAIEWTVNWYKTLDDRGDVRAATLAQIASFTTIT